MSVGLGLTARIGTYGAFVEARMHHAYVGEDLFASAETGTLTAGLVF